MQKISRFLRPIIELGLLALFTLFLILLFRSRPQPAGLLSQAEATLPVAYPAAATHLPVENDIQTYPPPGEEEAPATRLPRRVQALAEKRAALEGASAVMLEGGRLWQLPAEGPVTQLTDYNDVAVLYGWNFDGTKLLFGRGLYTTTGNFLAETTELWIYVESTNQSFRLFDSQKIMSASWSPVNDRLAFYEHGENPNLVVATSDGRILTTRENLFWDFTWSPDGSAIAVRYSGNELFVFGTQYTVLGVWWLEKDELHLLSNATREDHSNPVWTIDGRRIIFTRLFAGNEAGIDGLYIVDTITNQIELLPHSPELITFGVNRSPRSDTLVFNVGENLYTMELGQKPSLIGKGSNPLWHPNGMTIFYTDKNDVDQEVALQTAVIDQFAGGSFGVRSIQNQPKIFFK